VRYQSTLRQIDTVTRLNAQTNKNATRYIGLVANTVYHFWICIGKRGATRSVETPFGFWIRRGEFGTDGASRRPYFWFGNPFRKFAVFIVQNSNLF
jgi:hypothetical protein